MSKKKCIVFVVLATLLVSMAHEMLGSALGGQRRSLLVHAHPQASAEEMALELERKGGCEICYEVKGDLASTARILARRVSVFGLPWRLSGGGTTLRLHVAGVDELTFHDMLRMLEARQILGFHEVLQELRPGTELVPKAGEVLLEEEGRSFGAKGRFLLAEAPLPAARHLRSSSLDAAQAGKPLLRLLFDREGSKRLKEETSRLLGKKIALVVAGRVSMSLKVREAISGPGVEISGNFDPLKMATVLACQSAGELDGGLRRLSCRFLPGREAGGAGR